MLDLLYTFTILELFLGGGGRLLEIGPVTTRMILFAINLLVTAFLILTKQGKGVAVGLAVTLVLGFSATHIPALIIGFHNGSEFGDIFTDLSPQLYWLTAPFFAIVLQRESMVLRTAYLLRLSAITMAVSYLCVITALAIGQVDPIAFYDRVTPSAEFFFRNQGMFFYKGFLYLGIGAIFIAALGGRWSGLWLILVLTALVFTLTRGFVVSTAFAGVLMFWSMGRRRAVFIALCLAALAAFAVWVYLPSLDDGNFLEQREISNEIRIGDLAFLAHNINIGMLIFGEGFGAYINGRLNIENSYLATLWKTGMLGLAFWITPFILALHYFRNVERHSPHFYLACAYFFGVLLIYVQTGSNPYLTNPIGLSFVMVAIFSLRTLSISTPTSLCQRRIATNSELASKQAL
jgi:hypothetical protein